MDLNRDEATTLLAFMMAGADGDVDAEEEAAIAKGLADRNIMMSGEKIQVIREQALRTFDGSQAAWRRIRRALGDDMAREDAFGIALEVVMADDSLEPSEMAEIQEMADHLDISRAAMSRRLAKYA